MGYAELLKKYSHNTDGIGTNNDTGSSIVFSSPMTADDMMLKNITHSGSFSMNQIMGAKSDEQRKHQPLESLEREDLRSQIENSRKVRPREVSGDPSEWREQQRRDFMRAGTTHDEERRLSMVAGGILDRAEHQLDVQTKTDRDNGASFLSGLNSFHKSPADYLPYNDLYDDNSITNLTKEVNRIAKKQADGRAISESEQKVLNAYATYQTAQRYTEDNGGSSLLGGFSDGASGVTSFMSEIVATSPIARIASKGVSAAVLLATGKDIAAKKVAEAGASWGARAGVTAINSAKQLPVQALATAVQEPFTSGGYANTMQRRVEQYDFVDIAGDGNVTASLSRPSDEIEMALKGHASNWSELFTESIGTIMGAGKMLDLPDVNTLGKFAARANKWSSGRMVANSPTVKKTLDFLANNAYFNGMKYEISEELLNLVLEPVATFEAERIGDITWDDVLTTTFQTALTTSALNVVTLTPARIADAATSIAKGRKAASSLKNITDTELRQSLFDAMAQKEPINQLNSLLKLPLQEAEIANRANAIDYITTKLEASIYKGAVDETKMNVAMRDASVTFNDFKNRETGELIYATDENGAECTVISNIDTSAADGIVYVKYTEEIEGENRPVMKPLAELKLKPPVSYQENMAKVLEVFEKTEQISEEQDNRTDIQEDAKEAGTKPFNYKSEDMVSLADGSVGRFVEFDSTGSIAIVQVYDKETDEWVSQDVPKEHVVGLAPEADAIVDTQTPKAVDVSTLSEGKGANLVPQTQTIEREIPLLKDGTPNYDAMPAAMFVEEYSKVFSREEALQELQDEYVSIDGDIVKLEQKKAASRNEKVRNLSKIAELRAKLADISSAITNNTNVKAEPQQSFTVGDNVRQRYADAPKVYGNEKSIFTPNDEQIKGRYVLTESGVVTPSHNPKTFSQSEGFPVTENGSTVNDRDYGKDKEAQQQVLSIAQKYNGRAIDNPIVVSPDGVVISGNNRTMSGELAALNGTDKAYLQHLADNAAQYGFTPEQVSEFRNPRIVFETSEQQAYNTQTFAKFNAQETKTQNKVEKAIKIGKTIDEQVVRRVSSILDEHETLGEFYGDTRAVNQVVKTLQDAGVINQNEIAELKDGDNLSGTGKDMVETMLVGSVLSEDAVRLVNRDGMKRYRQRITKSIIPMFDNATLGDYSIVDEVSEAVALLDRARVRKSSVDDVLRMKDMFEQVEYSPASISIAKALEGSDKGVKQLFSEYNSRAWDAAHGQTSMFDDGVVSKQQILEEMGMAPVAHQVEQQSNTIHLSNLSPELKAEVERLNQIAPMNVVNSPSEFVGIFGDELTDEDMRDLDDISSDVRYVAIYLPSKDAMYLFADRIDSIELLRKTWLHETIHSVNDKLYSKNSMIEYFDKQGVDFFATLVERGDIAKYHEVLESNNESAINDAKIAIVDEAISYYSQRFTKTEAKLNSLIEDTVDKSKITTDLGKLVYNSYINLNKPLSNAIHVHDVISQSFGTSEVLQGSERAGVQNLQGTGQQEFDNSGRRLGRDGGLGRIHSFETGEPTQRAGADVIQSTGGENTGGAQEEPNATASSSGGIDSQTQTPRIESTAGVLEPQIDDPIASAKTPEQKHRAVTDYVSKLNELSGANAVVFSEISELPDEILLYIDTDRFDVDGISYEGVAYIYSPLMLSNQQTLGTYIHEVAGHQNVELAIKSAEQKSFFESIVDDIGVDAMLSLNISDLSEEVERFKVGEIAKKELGREYVAYLTTKYFTIDDFAKTSENFFVDLSMPITNEIIGKVLTSTNNGKGKIGIIPNRTGRLRSVSSAREFDQRSDAETNKEQHGTSSNVSLPTSPDGGGVGDAEVNASWIDEKRGVDDSLVEDRGALPQQDESGADRDKQADSSADAPVQRIGENNTIVSADRIEEARLAADIRFREVGNDYDTEMASIKSAAIKDGSFMQAQNGKPTNLNERQWLQVRTKAFKEWFGDWEKVYRIEKLRSSETVEIAGDEITLSQDIKEYKRNALEYGKNLRGEYVNADTGVKIDLSRSGLVELLQHDFYNTPHLQSIAAIPQIIEKAIYLTSIKNEDTKVKADKFDYYVVGLKVANEDYTVKMVVADINGKRYYDHKLSQIEKGNLIDLIRIPNLNQDDKTTLSDIKDKRLISILQTNSSKVVDANGEPMVVYHGTQGDFDAFDYDSINSENAFFFTDNIKLANDFGSGNGGNVIPAFLSIPNPSVIDAEGRQYGLSSLPSMIDVEDVVTNAQNQGNDGCIINNIVDTRWSMGGKLSNQYLVFSPNQIKSATGNNGEFNSKTDDIRYSDLDNINDVFNDELQQLVDGSLRVGHVFSLGMPSEALLLSGVPNLPIELSASRLKAKSEQDNHKFDLSNVTNLPEAIASPIAVFDSTKGEASKVILTELSNGKDNYVVVLNVHSKGRGRTNIEVNDIVSLYPKDHIVGIVDWINGGLMKWVNKEKALDFISVQWPNYIGNGDENKGFKSAVNNRSGIQQFNSAEDAIPNNSFLATKVIESFENSTNNLDQQNSDQSYKEVLRQQEYEQSKDAHYTNPAKRKVEAIKQLQKLSKQFSVETVIVDSVRDLPDNLKHSTKGKRFSGFYHKPSGKVYFVASEMRDADEATATFLHEVVSHKGIDGLMGKDNANKFYTAVFDSLKADEQERLLAKYGSKAIAGDEVVARMAEGDVIPSTMQRVIAAIRKFFREALNVPLTIKENDIRYILWKSKNNLQQAVNLPQAMGVIQRDKALQSKLYPKQQSFMDKVRDVSVRYREVADLGLKDKSTTVIFAKDGFTNFTQAKDWAVQNLVGKSFVNKDTNESIYINRESVNKMTSGKAVNQSISAFVHLKAIKALQPIIEESVLSEVHEDKKANPNVVEMQRFHGALDVDGELYRVKSTVRRLTPEVGGSKFYSYEVQEIELLKERQTLLDRNSITENPASSNSSKVVVDERQTLLDGNSITENPTSSTISMTKLLKGVKKTNGLEYFSERDEDIRFREVAADDARAEDVMPDLPYRASGKSKISKSITNATEALFDNKVKLQRLQNELSRRGVKITMFNNPYEAFNRFNGTTSGKMKEFDKRYAKPVIDDVKHFFQKYNLSYADVSTYINAKSSKEKHDKKVVKTLSTEKDGWNLKKVTEIIQDFEKVIDKNELDAFWVKWRAMCNQGLLSARESGRINDDDYNNIMARGLEYYAPLRDKDFDFEKMHDMRDYYDYAHTSRQTGARVEKVISNIRAKGRTTKAGDPISNAFSMVHQDIYLSEKNNVLRHLLRIVENNPSYTDLYQVRELWYEKVGDKWVALDEIPEAEKRKESNRAQRKKNALEKSLAEAIEKNEPEANLENYRNLIQEQDDKIIISRRNFVDSKTFDGSQSPNYVYVMKNGIKYSIEMKDPEIAAAINGISDNLPRWSILKAIASGTRGLASLATSKNPKFAIKNKARDFLAGLFYSYVKQGGNSALGFIKHSEAHYSTISRSLKGTSEPLTQNEMLGYDIFKVAQREELIKVLSRNSTSSSSARRRVEDTLYNYFEANGGLTGYNHTLTAKEQQAKLERDLKRELGNNYPDKIWHAAMNALDFVSSLSENSTRFAVFMSRIDQGEGVLESIKHAKNASVNFDRKGKYSSDFGVFYMFFNARFQAAKRLYDLYMGDVTMTTKERQNQKARFAIASTAYVGLGVLSGMLVKDFLMSLMGDDDKEHQFSEYERLTNFLLPSKSGAFKMPLDQSLVPFYAAGVLLADIYNGDKTIEDATPIFLEHLTKGLLPIDVNLNGDGITEKTLNFITPSIAQPLVDILLNVDFKDASVYLEDKYNNNIPDSQLGKKNVNPWLAKLTSWMNEVGGGNDIIPAGLKSDGSRGVATILDINPSKMEHLLKGYTSGIGSLVMDIVTTTGSVFKALDGDSDIETRRIPFVSSFYSEAYASSPRNEYWNIKKSIETSTRKVKQLKDKGLKVTEFEKSNELGRKNEMLFKRGGGVSFETKLKQTEQKINNIKKQFEEVQFGSDEYQSLESQIDNLQRQFIKEYTSDDKRN